MALHLRTRATHGQWGLGLTLACAAMAGAQAPDQAAAAPAPGPQFAVPASRDSTGRIAVPVTINGQGPFRFLLDTGANRSALTSRVATQLGLTLSERDAMVVQGVNGRVPARVALIASLQLGAVGVGAQRLPVLDGDVFAGLDGSLGADLLANLRVTADFQHDQVGISADHPAPDPYHFGVVRARKVSGWLLEADGHAGSTRLQMVIDTGSSQTLGNGALYRALTGHTLAHAHELHVAVIDATQTAGQGTTLSVSPIVLGDLMIQNTSVTFGDFPVFAVWGLEDTPALLLGMNVFGTLRGLTIDYQRRELTALP
jgi:predicted aspartyl protease